MPDLAWSHALGNASTSVVKGEQIPSGRLQIAGGLLARALVGLELVAELLAFDDIAHAGTFDGRDVNESVRTAVIRLNETEALGGIEPFYSASGHDEPFPSKNENRGAEAPWRVERCFKGRVRSKRDADRVVTKARQEKIDG